MRATLSLDDFNGSGCPDQNQHQATTIRSGYRGGNKFRNIIVNCATCCGGSNSQHSERQQQQQ